MEEPDQIYDDCYNMNFTRGEYRSPKKGEYYWNDLVGEVTQAIVEFESIGERMYIMIPIPE